MLKKHPSFFKTMTLLASLVLRGYQSVLKLNSDHSSSFMCDESILSNNKADFHCMETEGSSVLSSETEFLSWMNAVFYKLLRRVF